MPHVKKGDTSSHPIEGLERPSAKHPLSKSRYCKGVQCLKALYLSIHSPEKATGIDEATKMIMDQGRDVGVEARKCYPGGMLIDWDHLHGREALKASQEAMEHNPPALFEAAFFHHDTLVRIDVLKANGNGTWDLIEVKSGTKFDEKHLPDMAVQKYVAEGAGLKIDKVWLKHINNRCVYPDFSNLFSDVDCTAIVNEAAKLVPERIDQMLTSLTRNAAPDSKIGVHCDKPYECNFKGNCWKDVPKHSVLELSHVWGKDKFALWEKGTRLISEIPVGQKVSRAKPRQLESVRTNRPIVNKVGLRDFAARAEYPRHFFDFETWNPALPRHDGMRPYQNIQFQFSCHVIENAGAEAKHYEFLADGTRDPRNEIIDLLLKALGKKGSIIAFNADFEIRELRALAEFNTAKSDQLLQLIPRFIDLHDPFDQHYYHPEFRGSLSLKDILPVLVPGMTYAGMEVAHGGDAQFNFMSLCDPSTSEAERKRLRADLLEYCKQDTLAMVKLFEWLEKFVAA